MTRRIRLFDASPDKLPGNPTLGDEASGIRTILNLPFHVRIWTESQWLRLPETVRPPEATRIGGFWIDLKLDDPTKRRNGA
jgi:hypothetical protein